LMCMATLKRSLKNNLPEVELDLNPKGSIIYERNRLQIYRELVYCESYRRSFL
jgi:hypothetical protein